MIIKVKNESGLERFKREVIRKKKPSFAMFHMKGCGHCIILRPEWDKMKKKVGSSLILAEIDSSYSSLVTNLIGGQVTGFPTLMVIKKGRRITEYNGERKENEMLKFINQTFKKVGGRRMRKRRSRKKNRRTRRRRSRRRKTRRRSR